MVGSVVETFEHDIFEEHATLSAPVVLTDSVDDFANWISFFHWHDFHSLVVERRVEADGEVAFRLVEETFHIRYHAHCRYCDASRTHGEAPVGGHHVERAHEVVVVVHRLAHSHKYVVGKFLVFREVEYLVQDIASRKILLETLFASLAEEAVHFAAHLRRDA